MTSSSRGVPPFSSTLILTCEMAGLSSLPRTVFLLEIPFLLGLNPGVPRIKTRFLPLPWTSGRIGNPDVSLPPVIFSLYPGSPRTSPSTTSPTALPTRAFVLASSSSYWMDFPVSGSEITSLYGNNASPTWSNGNGSLRTPAVAKLAHFMRIVVGPPLVFRLVYTSYQIIIFVCNIDAPLTPRIDISWIH